MSKIKKILTKLTYPLFGNLSYKVQDEIERRLNYYNATVVYVKSGTRIALGYGRTREGIFCVGGVCRFVPASNGLVLSVTSSF